MSVRHIAACSTADDIGINLIALVTILQQEAGYNFYFALQQTLPATSKPSCENQNQLPLHTSHTAVTVGSSKHGHAAAHQAKRQKVEQPDVVDSKPAAQPLHEARSVAADTKQQLGLTGNTLCLHHAKQQQYIDCQAPSHRYRILYATDATHLHLEP